MYLKQTAVFLENKPGHLLEISSLLSENEINIHFLSIADTEKYGILRFITKEHKKAQKLLIEKEYAVKESNVIAVELKDQAGILQQILKLEKEAQINIEYMYGMTQKNTQNAIMLFRFDDNEKGLEALKVGKFPIMSETQFFE